MQVGIVSESRKELLSVANEKNPPIDIDDLHCQSIGKSPQTRVSPTHMTKRLEKQISHFIRSVSNWKWERVKGFQKEKRRNEKEKDMKRLNDSNLGKVFIKASLHRSTVQRNNVNSVSYRSIKWKTKEFTNSFNSQVGSHRRNESFAGSISSWSGSRKERSLFWGLSNRTTESLLLLRR